MLGFISYYHIDFEKLEIVEQPEIGEPTIYFFIGLLSLDSFEFLYKRTLKFSYGSSFLKRMGSKISCSIKYTGFHFYKLSRVE